MIVTAGIDIGSTTTKAVVLKDTTVVGYARCPTGVDCTSAALQVVTQSLAMGGLQMSDIRFILATGYGRNVVSIKSLGNSVPFETMTEINCHAVGVKSLFPATMTIIDIGGQDSKAISLNADGSVKDRWMNDKCAAGTGRFFEQIAARLGMTVDQLGTCSLASKSPARLNSTCTVFAETEVISLLAQKKPPEDIAAGLHQAVARRVCAGARRVGIQNEVIFTGGVAENVGMHKALEEELQKSVHVLKAAPYTGAIGAGVLAYQRIGQS
jgi:predicted CoA-substrate-specific enzyme activase